jgi:hypothetical protein
MQLLSDELDHSLQCVTVPAKSTVHRRFSDDQDPGRACDTFVKPALVDDRVSCYAYSVGLSEAKGTGTQK